jgi:hypothetical protein
MGKTGTQVMGSEPAFGRVLFWHCSCFLQQIFPFHEVAMKLLVVLLLLCSLVGCEMNKTTSPNATKVKIDVDKGGVDVEVNKK